MSNWTLYSNTHTLIENSLGGGSVYLKAYKDFTCELTIKLFIEAFDDELFISIAIHNHRESHYIPNLKKLSKSQITSKIIEFVFATANKSMPKNQRLEMFNTGLTANQIKRNIERL